MNLLSSLTLLLLLLNLTACSPGSETSERQVADQGSTENSLELSSTVRINGKPAIKTTATDELSNAVSDLNCDQLKSILESNNVRINGKPALRQSAEELTGCLSRSVTETSSNVAIGG
jgi:uncharacterized Zn-binding protein involved in type VI secretion